MEENLNLDLSHPEVEVETPPKTPTFKVLKIITAVFYGLVVAFLIATFIDAILSYDPTNSWSGLGFAVYLVVVILVIGSCANFVPTVLAVIGIILSVKKRSQGCPKSTTTFFIVFAILPYLTEAVVFAVSYLVFASL